MTKAGAWALLPFQGIAVFDQLFKFFGLLLNPVGRPLLILSASGACRLLDQLTDVVSKNGNTIFEFGER